MISPVATLKQLDGKPVFEVDVAGLPTRQLAKRRPPVTGVPFQIHRLGDVRQHVGLAGAGHAGQHGPVALCTGLRLGLDEKVAQRLVAARDPGAGDAGLGQPLLHCLGAQAAAKTVEQGVGLLAQPGQPAFHARGAHRATHQLMAQGDGCGLSLLLVTGTDPGTLLVRHQRQADGGGKGPFLELDGGTQIDEWNLIQKIWA